MYVTEIIKQSEVRKFLLENFPKPIVNRKEIFPEISSTENKNPSLTGNAFEIFLCLLSAKTNQNIENNFEFERENALLNLKQTQKSTNEGKNFKGHLRIYLNKDDYEMKIGQIKKLLSKKSISLKEVSNKFRCAMIENIKDHQIWNIIAEKTNLHLAGGPLDIIYRDFSSLLWGDIPPYSIIIDKESLASFIDATIKKFEKESSAFIQKRELDKNFVELILEFTQISSQFFRSVNVTKGLHFEESYMNYVYDLFNIIYQRKDIHGKKLLYKPSLKSLGILATPDFLIEYKILEIKTSKEFFSIDDYLQALIYLILSQDKQNKKRWGVIKEIEIFYPVFNKSIKLKLKENDDRIKPALKFLKEYSTNEPKRKLKRLKEIMLKERKNKKRK